MPRTKIVNGIRYDFTPEEEAQYEADAEAFDLDLHAIRSERNTRLRVSDWTRLDDATLGDHTAEEWADYRALLRALPQTYNRVSEVVWPEDPPTAKVTRKRAAGDAAKQSSLDGGGTDEEAQAAYDTAYDATE